LGAGARLLELYVTKTQSSVVVPKVVIDEVQKPISGRPERNKQKVRYRQLLANRAPHLLQLDQTQECDANRTHAVSVVKEKSRGIVFTVSETFA
jgi:hypothetical protein